MMKKIASFIFIFLVVAVALAALYYFGNYFLTKITMLSPNVAAAIIAGLAAVTAAIYTQRQTRIREIEEKHRDRKIELYSIFMDIIDYVFELSRNQELEKIQENSIPPKLEELFKKFRRGLLFWASPNVILAYPPVSG